MPGRAKSNTRKSRELSDVKELLIIEAVRLYEKSNTSDLTTKLGYRSATKHVEQLNYERTKKWVSLDHNTVRNRHLEITKSLRNGHYSSQSLLTHAEEEELVSYAIEVANRGFPLTHRRLQECANRLIQTSRPDFTGVGQNWSERFLERHYESLHVYWSRSLESARGKAVNPASMKAFYDLLEEEYIKHSFEPHNVHGVDESGLMSGVAQKERVIGGTGKKTQHQKREVNRENTTIIVTICADGSTIPPVTIFKGKHYQMKWLQDNPLNASFVMKL